MSQKRNCAAYENNPCSKYANVNSCPAETVLGQNMSNFVTKVSGQKNYSLVEGKTYHQHFNRKISLKQHSSRYWLTQIKHDYSTHGQNIACQSEFIYSTSPHWDLILSYLSRECFGPNTSFAMPRKSRAMLSFIDLSSLIIWLCDTLTMITPKIKSKLWLMNVISIHPSLYSISNENVRGIYKLTTWYACPCVAASIYSKKNLCVSHFRVNMVVWTNRQEFLAWYLSTK